MPGLPVAGPAVVLIIRTGTRRCALHAAHVIEVMRPLPVEPFADFPDFVRGLSVIRGVPVPVVDLAGILGDEGVGRISRFVSLRVGKRCVALAVEEVIDLRTLEASGWDELPPLLVEKNSAMDAIGILDDQLLLLLGTARMVPEEVWKTLEKPGI